jgi:Ca2+-transporting ATPase
MAMTTWHARQPETLARDLQSNVDTGLTGHEAERRLSRHGSNELPGAPPFSIYRLLLVQFSSMIVWVLVGAAVVSGLLGEWMDTAAILAIVLLNAILGFAQEYKAERSLTALRKLSLTTARVIRDGIVCLVPARDLVPGDLIRVETGDHVPADARLIYAASLRTQEAALTGESTPVDKSPAIIPSESVPLADRKNMLFLGTNVAAGKGRALVVATGPGTELGRIACLMQGAEREPTPLQRRLTHLGHSLLYASLAIVGLVFVLGMLRGEPLGPMFLTAVSLAVAAIPEGLPAIVTVSLALGVTRMVQRHALVRRLPAVETLGSTTVICTDKTGTLTKNEMTVTRLYVDGRWLEVTGEGYAPSGDIIETGRSLRDHAPPGLRDLMKAAVLCNGSTLKREQEGWRVVGDPTEGALLAAAAKLGLRQESLEATEPLAGEVPFDPERKMMTMVRRTSGGLVAYVKGAPDVLLSRCTSRMTVEGQVEGLTDDARAAALHANSVLAQDALRVLALACRPLDRAPDLYRADDLERDLIFLGLAGMKDPLRPEARAAVRACRNAGIRTVMITGDHKGTAVAIARELGLLVEGTEALSGEELDRMSDEALRARVDRIAVFARVSAEHKLRIVRAWKARGAIVAMTGDGVNDAPAVKEADIGIAMGLTGTDVTKEASAMVATDDNFASIEAAVEEGRRIYDNILKAVHYLLSCNLSEVLVMLFAAFAGLPLPLVPVQILWINLITDGLPALALAVDPTDPDIMRRQPRDPWARILDRRRIAVVIVQGLVMALVTIGAFSAALHGAGHSLDVARTLTFTVLVFVQLAHALNCRSDAHSLFEIGWATNRPLLWAVSGSALLQAAITFLPPAQAVFKTAALEPVHWALAIGLGLLPLLTMELWKRMARRS